MALDLSGLADGASGWGPALRSVLGQLVVKGDLFANVKDYGATGDGSTNDTVAIQAAIDAVQSAGGAVFFPRGEYVAGTLSVTGSGVTLFGTGGSSRIKNASATANQIEVRSNVHTTIERLSFESVNGQTAGACISLDAASWVHVTDVTMGYYSKIWHGVNVSSAVGNSQSIYLTRVLIMKHQGAAFKAEVTNAARVINDIFIDSCWFQWVSHGGSVPSSATIGIHLNRTAGALQVVNITNTEVSSQWWALSVTGVTLLKSTASYFDAYTTMTGARMVRFASTWLSGSTSNGNASTNAHIVVDSIDVRFTGCELDPVNVADAVSGAALIVQGTSRHVTVTESTFAGGAPIGVVGTGGDFVYLHRNYFANNSALPNTPGMTKGITITSGFTGYLQVVGNDLGQMTTAFTNGHLTPAKVLYTQNPGIN